MTRNVIFICLAVMLVGCKTRRTSPASDFDARAKTTLSTMDGALQLPGLQQPVTVKRDRWGVAHIYAQNQHDLFFAQGFIVAQDRLFQMELWKRSGQGRLAEILGKSSLQRDIDARLLQYRGDMNAEYESYSPDTLEILEAFTSGINAYIARRLRPGGPGLPIEFQLAGFEPEPWKPADCLNRMAAFSMTGNAFRELQHAEAAAAVGAERATRLFEFDPSVDLDPAPGANFSGLSSRLLKGLVGSDSRIEFPRNSTEGSNNWTISGSLTETGKPLLANDPHRVTAEPSLRYMVHLVAPGWDVIGAGEPGLPGVALGHNSDIAWGFTIFGIDQQDIYIEQLNPDDPNQYKTEHGWEPLRIEKATLGIRGGQSVTVDLKFTRHGPVLWEDGKRALALRWVGSEPGTAGYLQSLAVDRSMNWQDFEQAMTRWKVPSENVVYADQEGNIGEHSVGLAPVRKNWTGLLPEPGGGGYEWSGFLSADELPHTYNPAAGFVASANQKMIPKDYRYQVGYEWEPPYRYLRITQVLDQARASRHKLTTVDMENLQSDVVSLPAHELIDLLRRATGERLNDDERLLFGWDNVVSRESSAAALYEIWTEDLTTAVLQRTVPDAARTAVLHWPLSHVIEIVSHPTQEVFGSNPAEARDRLLRDTLKSGADRLATLEGPDRSKWAWGRLHEITFRHPLDQTVGVSSFLDTGPIARPGDEDTVNATAYWGGSFEQREGATYREILDLSDWDKSVGVNSPGQSGQPQSAHYRDLAPPWSEGQYFPLAYSEAAVNKVTEHRLLLQP